MEKKNARRHEVLERLEHHGGVSPEAVRAVAEETGVPEADVYGAGRFYTLLTETGPTVRVCQGLTCKLAGSDALYDGIVADGHHSEKVSCLGQCDRAPVSIAPDRSLRDAGPRGGVSPDNADLPINLGGVDTADGSGARRAAAMGGAAVIDQVKAAGLQGRGGAGFPAWIKWRSVSQEADPVRYLVVNADEGEPGTFKDREILLRRPLRLVEGVVIAATAVAANEVYIYIRGEFSAERKSVEGALERAAEAGWLGDLEVRLVVGHGAYICGEETALLESIEGRRGMPRIKPPYPTQSGLFGKPTLIHNVETLACLPSLIVRGGEWFRQRGRTEPGSKLYCVSGHVQSPGVYELPLGVSLDEVVAAAGGYRGTPAAFSPGGASSGFLPMSERARPLDFKGLAAIGSMLGSAGVVVLDDTVDMAEMAREQAVFFEDETCGQCAPCRIGARMLRQALDRYLGSGDPKDLAHVDDIAWEMEEGSICGLGIAAPLPLTSARKHFPGAFGRRPPGSSDV